MLVGAMTGYRKEDPFAVGGFQRRQPAPEHERDPKLVGVDGRAECDGRTRLRDAAPQRRTCFNQHIDHT